MKVRIYNKSYCLKRKPAFLERREAGYRGGRKKVHPNKEKILSYAKRGEMGWNVKVSEIRTTCTQSHLAASVLRRHKGGRKKQLVRKNNDTPLPSSRQRSHGDLKIERDAEKGDIMPSENAMKSSPSPASNARPQIQRKGRILLTKIKTGKRRKIVCL